MWCWLGRGKGKGGINRQSEQMSRGVVGHDPGTGVGTDMGTGIP